MSVVLHLGDATEIKLPSNCILTMRERRQEMEIGGIDIGRQGALDIGDRRQGDRRQEIGDRRQEHGRQEQETGALETETGDRALRDRSIGRHRESRKQEAAAGAEMVSRSRSMVGRQEIGGGTQ